MIAPCLLLGQDGKTGVCVWCRSDDCTHAGADDWCVCGTVTDRERRGGAKAAAHAVRPEEFDPPSLEASTPHLTSRLIGKVERANPSLLDIVSASLASMASAIPLGLGLGSGQGQGQGPGQVQG